MSGQITNDYETLKAGAQALSRFGEGGRALSEMRKRTDTNTERSFSTDQKIADMFTSLAKDGPAEPGASPHPSLASDEEASPSSGVDGPDDRSVRATATCQLRGRQPPLRRCRRRCRISEYRQRAPGRRPRIRCDRPGGLAGLGPATNKLYVDPNTGQPLPDPNTGRIPIRGGHAFNAANVNGKIVWVNTDEHRERESHQHPARPGERLVDRAGLQGQAL